jgi:stage II sporulation protein D
MNYYKVKFGIENLYKGMKGLKRWIALMLLVTLTLTGCVNKGNIKESTTGQAKTQQNVSTAHIESIDTIPVTRATVAKMIALAFNDKNTIMTTDYEIAFVDVEQTKWYAPYINMVVLQGYMSGDDKGFKPDEPLTLNQAQILLGSLNKNNKTKIKITEEIKNKPISYALWTELYINTLKALSKDKALADVYAIATDSLIVLATPANNATQKPWTMTTDKGSYGFAGLNMDSYMDCKVKVYSKDYEVIALAEIEDTQPTLTNAYLVAAKDTELTIFVQGATRTYKTTNDMVLDTTQFTIPIIDLKIKGDTIVQVGPSKNKINGRLLSVDGSKVELDSGKREMAADMKVYSNIDGNIEAKSIKSIVTGSDMAEYVIKQDKICAAIIHKNITPSTIRVALNTNGFASLIHSTVKLTATSDFTLSYKGGTKDYKAGEILEVSKDINATLFDSDRIYITPKNGKVVLQSITRAYGNPKYRGTIEIAKKGDGYCIVNEVGLEEYLYSVVPSEMPTDYGFEAAKVQAITARSYAYNQIFSNKYYTYGASVEDSIQSQVYNNTAENELSIKAVDATKNKVLTYNGGVISSNFFSTSAGVTANSGEVWMNTTTKEFPATTPAYLTSVKQYLEADYGDLSNEDNAAKFFKTIDMNAYDAKFSWFRWNTTMTAKALSASINANLKERYQANNAAIKTFVKENTYKSKPVETIGELTDLQVLKRGAGGNIMELLLVGTSATIKVSTEYNVRALLKPFKYIEGSEDVIINRKDGTKLSNYSLMPSAFFTFDKSMDEQGKLSAVTFYGGGNGHGAGMSQNGVKAMSDLGFNYEKILLHYYSGTEIRDIN